MNIRTRITLLFFSIVIVVLTAVSLSIYLLSSNYRKEDFFRRLKNRAINTAKILVEVKEVNAELLRRLEQNNPASLPNQYIVIYDSAYQILYSSENKQVIPVDAMLFANIRAQKEIKFVVNHSEAIGFTFKDGTSTYVIVAAANDVYGNDALGNLRNTLIIIFFVSIVLVSIIGWFYAGRVLQPISRLVREVSEITEENLSRRLDEGNGQDELGKLANTFNKILERLQDAFVAQKTFIANASHEVKTPITVMAGEIEVTLLHDREKNYYIKILRSVLRGLRGLNRLSTQLLVLAQTSSDNPQKNNALLRIDDVLWDAKEESARFHHDYTISIQLDLHSNDESLSVHGDHQLLKIAFMNLIDNGCKYSDNNKVNVELKVANESSIEITFSNSGSPIPQEVAEKIFDPFFRSTEPGKNVQGFGIGLSLAKRIVELHNGHISLQTNQNQLTTFIVSLPIQARRV
jgi:signal transduction histidine kinase